MNLLPIARHLEAQKVGKLAQDLFINMIPAKANNGILLRNPLVGTRIDYEMTGYINTEFQVIVRATNYELGEQQMKKVFAALTIENVKLDTLYVKMCYPLFEPVVYPLSDGNLLEFSTDFRFVGHQE